MSDFRYKAFISYSWKDRAAVEALHRALEAFRTPKSFGPRAGERLVPIFRDRDEEAAGASLKIAIEDALDHSEFLVVACSPNSRQSPWVNREIAYFRKHRAPANVLCYALAGEPGPEIFPPALIYESTAEGDISDQLIEAPLAADAREEGDGPRLARLKIIAAMLGVGLDDLVRRDAQRRARRMRAALGAVSAVALGFAGVAAYAVVQRNEAVASAERARREALKAERTSEFMVSLFEVVDPGEARGREVTAKEILDKGVRSIEADLANEPDVQGSLMHTMGRVYTGLGLYPEAARILGVARDKRAQTKADPADLFATENALARAKFEEGDLDGAREVYARLVKEAEADIAKGGWRADYATALIGMGETTLYRDTPEEAQGYYERARDLLSTHGMAESEEMAEALRGLANAAADSDDLKSSQEYFLKALALTTKIFGPDDFRNAAIENDLAGILYLQNELAPALERYRRIIEIETRTLGARHPETLMTMNNAARMSYELGDLEAADEVLNEVVRISIEIGRDRDVDMAFPLNTLGEVLVEKGDYDSALSLMGRALGIAATNEHRLYGPIRINMGRARCASGDPELGAEDVEMGTRALATHYEESNWRYGVAQENRSRCLVALGRLKEAQAPARAAYKRLNRELGAEHFFSRRAKRWLQSVDGT